MRQKAANCDVIDLMPFSRADVSCKIFQVAGIGLNGVWRSVALAQGEKKPGDRGAYNGFSFRTHSLPELSFRRVVRNTTKTNVGRSQAGSSPADLRQSIACQDSVI